MNTTPTRLMLLLTAIAIPIAPAPTSAVGATPLKVCVLTGAGTTCEAPGSNLRVVRPMEIR